MIIKNYIILLFIFTAYPQEKSSSDIQQEIDSRDTQIKLLKKEITKVEENIIEKTKNEINASEIIIEIQNKIILTKKLIRSIEREEKIIQRKIDKSQIEMKKKEAFLKSFQSKLKENIIYIYKNGTPTFIESILILDDLSDLIYKTKYLNILNSIQKKNKKEIKKLILEIENDNNNFKKTLNEKKQLKKNKKNEKETLEKDIIKKRELLDHLNKEKEQEQLKLNSKQQALTEIENIINKLYSDKSAQLKREQQLVEIRKIQKMSANGNFNSMRGKLPWPVRGKIISKFGSKKNKKLKTITENIGIDIKASKNNSVIAILDGVISTITYIRGHGNVIIIDHGDGFNTVYANVENILVEENNYIQAGTQIATLNNEKILHFEIWGNQKKLNPEKWLIK